MAQDQTLSVAQAMGLAKQALEQVRVTVVGEVSEFNDRPGYKAAYFTVCDSDAAMPCLMWRDAYEASGVNLRCGTLVEITGQFSAYAPKGRMQFQVRKLQLAGEGNLRIQVAELARRLEVEGLMRPERKRALPRYPERIAVVTSPRGKAIHDVLRTLRRRYPLAELLVAGVAVEGDGAPEAIAGGIRTAAQARPDVLLLVRGGGSYEDLMPFNSEAVARAVAGCPVPVITGIGHEPDTSIADMVADLRASTPTAAAEASAPSCDEIATLLTRERRALARALQHQAQAAAHRVARIAQRPAFCDPHALLGQVHQTLDMARMRLHRAIPQRLSHDAQRVALVDSRMRTVGQRLCERDEAKMRMYAARLDDLSPLAILRRGYSATFSADGHTVVRSIGQVQHGERILVRVSDGRIGCEVTDLEKEG